VTALTVTVVPLTVNVGAVGAAGTLRKLALLLAAVACVVPDIINLAEKSWSEPADRPANSLLVCQAPVPLRYWVVQPVGALIAVNVTDVVVLLDNPGAPGLAGFGTVIVLVVDHALSVFTL